MTTLTNVSVVRSNFPNTYRIYQIDTCISAPIRSLSRRSWTTKIRTLSVARMLSIFEIWLQKIAQDPCSMFEMLWHGCQLSPISEWRISVPTTTIVLWNCLSKCQICVQHSLVLHGLYVNLRHLIASSSGNWSIPKYCFWRVPAVRASSPSRRTSTLSRMRIGIWSSA